MNENLNELFHELLAASQNDDVRNAYRTLRFVLNRSVDVALRDVSVQFSGLFAKTNYLLTEHKAQQEFVRSMGSTRNRIRHQHELGDDELLRCRPYDVKNLCLFIALVFPDVEIPESLKQQFPVGTLSPTWSKADIRYLRVIVKTVEGSIIHAVADNDNQPEVRINIGQDNQYLQFDYSYLPPLLSDGTQLNLVHPRQKEDGMLLPELVIFEPDYLIDISSIAGSFKEYGVTPLTNLLRKISPSRQTRATLLGDFASQLLDEEVHGTEVRSYADSIGDFCRQRTLAMAACDDLDSSFHQDALQQKKNIHKAISEDLPHTISDYDAEKVVLEPSFVCEMLGIQGRMDFLQTDYRVLIEQKSGKAAFVPEQRGVDTPVLTVPHYVQLLLYRALLHYGFDMPNEHIRPLLLYSKYTNPLVQTDSAPQLLYEAFCLRNQLVWLELHLGEEGFGLLRSLTADQLNKVGTRSKLWLQYTRPDIEKTLSAVRNASDLERAYYLRMLQFVQREHILTKIGNKRKENSGFAARWHDSLEEKRQAGNIYDNLSLTIIDGDAGIEKVRLDFSEDALIESANFRVGDIVTFYPYQLGTEPDCRNTMLHRATIENITQENITLRLRAPQTNRHIFTNHSPLSSLHSPLSWAIEHDFMESSYGSLYRGVHSFLSASSKRKDLILSQRTPLVDETACLSGEYGAFNDLSLRVRQAQELFLIIGPPGTGKTSFGMLNTLKEELLQAGSSIAVMAFTNRAVDEVCSKLVAEGIDFIRIGSELSCDERFRPYLLYNKVEGMGKISDIRSFIQQQRVVVGTTTAFCSHQEIFALRSFSLAIIDEASQILEPQLLGILSAQHNGAEAIRKFVMIGDHKQLPAVVQQTQKESYVDDACLREMGLTDCRLSLFERLLARYKDDPSVVYMLSRQGRMHEEIAQFPNQFFYSGRLSCVLLPHQVEPSKDQRVTFIDVPDSNSISQKGWGGVSNLAEAEAIADIVLREHTVNNVPLDQIGIIVPYRNQISAVRNALSSAFTKKSSLFTLHPSLTIDTVERFQGSQREVIIYGFTVKRPYQLDFLTDNCFVEDGAVIDRKLNVAMTRAMKRLYLVGNAKLLRRNALFASLIDFLQHTQR